MLITLMWINFKTPSVEKKTISESYPGSWTSDGYGFRDIAKAFIKNNTHGCGEFHYKAHSSNSGEYLVACSSDGVEWSYYLVFTLSEDVIGPLSNPLTNELDEEETISSPY